ncbi:hypothetical protein ACCS91_33695 [Rhizobium ruizarguesonis]
MGRRKSKFTIEELEADEIRLKGRISRLQEELETTQGLLHIHYRDKTRLVGCIPRSARVPGGLRISDVTFKTWDRRTPQSVSGYRLDGAGTWTTIHVNSPGYEVTDDAHPASNAA